MAQQGNCLLQPGAWPSVSLAHQAASREEKKVILTQSGVVSALYSSARRSGGAVRCLGLKDCFCLFSHGEDGLPTFPLLGMKGLASFIFSTLQEMRLLHLLS